MLTDKRIPGKLEKIEKRYEALRFRKVAEVPMEMAQTLLHFRHEPDRRDGDHLHEGVESPEG